MNVKIKINRKLIIVFLIGITSSVFSQEVDKVLFLKPIPAKIQNAAYFSFSVGYVATENRDISLDLSGGPNKIWSGKTVKVKKGRGLIDISLTPQNGVVEGEKYKLILSMRESGGSWQTAMAGTSVYNLEIVKGAVTQPETAAFSLATPTVYESKENYNLNVDYTFPNPGAIQVSIWKGGQWIGTSKKIDVSAGTGTKKVQVSIPQQQPGKDYRFQLNFGSNENFKNKNTSVVNLNNIWFKKPEKKLTMKEINEKSIQISLNKDAEVLTLPGKLSYKYIRIISVQGAILKEVSQTNKIQVSNLKQGPYFVVTSDADYYKFVKF
ncbi:hypothetical protein [Flavicella marina]|uniref:hypothetical protein n=1 Tax=Flavicella marina TaxID=1475951 RepID=UPI0012644221|nr:hypothetical protein [Flavicella marina]